jgi:hypothetical protein
MRTIITSLTVLGECCGIVDFYLILTTDDD